MHEGQREISQINELGKGREESRQGVENTCVIERIGENRVFGIEFFIF